MKCLRGAGAVQPGVKEDQEKPYHYLQLPEGML